MGITTIQLSDRTRKKLAAMRDHPRETYEETVNRLMGLKYSDAGVDVEKGDEASKMFYAASRKTWSNRIKAGFDDFTGLRYVRPPQGKDVVMGENFDGVGTKVEVAQRLRKHDTIAFDLLAMVCDDAVLRGGEPYFTGNVLDVNKVSLDEMGQLSEGLVAAAKDANVAVLNGEIAELGEHVGGYGSFKYNWCASCIWFAKKNKMLDGTRVKEGDSIIALKEGGFRSNGLSLARKIMERAYGKEWHEANSKLAEAILEPSRIYSRLMVSLSGGVEGKEKAEVHAAAHITGGGIAGKLGRALKPSGLGASLNYLFPPCEAMLELQDLGGVEDEEAYRTWNMGNGFMIITPEPDAVLKEAKRLGFEAKLAGKVIKDKTILLESKGFQKEGKMLSF